MTTNLITDGETYGQPLTKTAHRLVAWGCVEREACALANVITLEPDASDAVVEQAVIEALVAAKQAVSGVAEIEYLGGQRRDTLRLEGRQMIGRLVTFYPDPVCFRDFGCRPGSVSDIYLYGNLFSIRSRPSI